MTLYRHEMKMNLKSLIIWTLCVGGLCFGCILLYTSLEESLQDIADVYSNMGAMSTALGMDKMSLATLTGFYATEIAMMHGLGGAMFAAILGTGMLSKEEAGHTSEFLNVFPIGRKQIIIEKYLALISNILLFNLVCTTMYVVGFVMMGEELMEKEMVLYHLAQFLMQAEIGTVCFMISAFSKKNLMGAGLGIAILMFAADMMCRIIPAIENVKYITPFYYSNGADIFTSGEIDGVMLGIGVLVIVLAFIIAFGKYRKKDLAA
ncbi:MAG: ABC transporter permease subunit [Lachnospiraceae bacterium]|nr:ABC transporter permease subunit [Lachnospiraceae bacterium]